MKKKDLRDWMRSEMASYFVSAINKELRDQIEYLQKYCQEASSVEKAGMAAVRLGGYISALEYVLNEDWHGHIDFEEDQEEEKETYEESDGH